MFKKCLVFACLLFVLPLAAEVYCHRPQTLNLDSARQSPIEALRSERGCPSPRGKGDEEDRLGKVAASPNSKFDADGSIKVLALAGSTRKDSYNKKLIQVAADIARQKGAKVTVIDLNDYQMPFYDADYEAKQGLPVNAKKLRDLMLQNDVMMISSPEYNASIPGILKNTLDWTSRDEKAQYSSDPYKGKKIAIMSASPGKGGGARALVHLRAVLQAVGGDVIKDQVSVPEAFKAFDAKGKLVSAETNKKLQEEVQELLSSAPKSSDLLRN